MNIARLISVRSRVRLLNGDWSEDKLGSVANVKQMGEMIGRKGKVDVVLLERVGTLECF